MHRPVLIASLLVMLLCACNLATQVVTPTSAIPTVSFQFPDNNVSIVEGTDLQIQLLAQDAVDDRGGERRRECGGVRRMKTLVVLSTSDSSLS